MRSNQPRFRPPVALESVLGDQIEMVHVVFGKNKRYWLRQSLLLKQLNELSEFPIELLPTFIRFVDVHVR